MGKEGTNQAEGAFEHSASSSASEGEEVRKEKKKKNRFGEEETSQRHVCGHENSMSKTFKDMSNFSKDLQERHFLIQASP